MPQPSVSVLVVDDESSLRKALRGSLSASGFAVEEARSGEEAVNTVQQASFDVVLLDMNMPGMGGLEACRRIRGLRPNAGIVMVTVRDAEDDKVSALEAGADDYVTKPFQLRELIARLRAVLRRTQLGGAKEEDEEVLQVGDLVVNLKRRSLMRAGRAVRLSQGVRLAGADDAKQGSPAHARQNVAHHLGARIRRGAGVFANVYSNASQED